MSFICFQYNRKLKKLNLSHNSFDEDGGKIIAKSIGKDGSSNSMVNVYHGAVEMIQTHTTEKAQHKGRLWWAVDVDETLSVQSKLLQCQTHKRGETFGLDSLGVYVNNTD